MSKPIIAETAKQAMTWERFKRYNDFNEPEFYPAKTIKGGATRKDKIVQTSTGDQAIAEIYVTTKIPVGIGDQVDGRTVLTAGAVKDLDGAVMYYEAYTK